MGFIDNLGRDWLFIRGVVSALRVVTPMARNKTRTFSDAAEDLARQYGDRPALLSDRESLTFRQYDARANRYARWAMAHGIEKGDVVCLMMPNRPEYAAIWLGIVRAGGVVALLNTNLRGAALAHCVNLVRPKHVIVDSDLAAQYDTADPLVVPGAMVWRHGGPARNLPRVDESVMELSDAPIPKNERPPLTLDDPCLYIYTSGTTGLPKAAHINHYRVYAAMLAFSKVIEATENDRVYNCLPMYHTSGGVLAIGSALVAGGSTFIREKFSASHFWDDVVDNRCTRFQYIGELCRYLLNAPTHPKEQHHAIRICCGNGLRPDIWMPFKERFGIEHIREFYAATEGNAILFNFDDMPGAVGRIPRWARPIFPVTTIRFDINRETPVRGEDGLCIECDVGEVGELVSQIVINPLKPGQRFDGYADKVETEKKILRDVFVAGDMWFRSGDLMRRDERGYFFFVDRIGDTYRWKGENVSTSEVAEALGVCPGVAEVNVYGIAITGADGRAGMAAVVPGPGFDLATLRAHMHAVLSPHARPIFVRVTTALDATSTFKQRKLDLVRQGCDPSSTLDPIYFDDPAAGRFVRMDAALFGRLNSGAIRL
ncbi:MAG TPA: long-chain-acyl-CoA synthetase [Bauldia sp.]|nr:long-chain-acyl-CoA synthetase [Bauldia sp.]